MINTKSHLDEKVSKNGCSPLTEKDIFTSRKHSMDYFTSDGVILRTGYKNKLDWYLLPIREGLDNAVDFLWKYYGGSDKGSIALEITIDNLLFTIKLTNSNQRNIPIFNDLKSVFDYDVRYGSKQNMHVINRGMLGDAMKQILSLGYVLLHVNDDGRAFSDRQWDYPLVIRHNQQESKVFLTVDKAAQTGQVRIAHEEAKIEYPNTELEITLPIIKEVQSTLTAEYNEDYCRKYSLLTTDITIKFSISDKREADIRSSNTSVVYSFDIPSTHPINLLTNSNSIHSFTPEEFIAQFLNVHDKNSTTVYDVLKAFREGSHIKKSEENELSVAKLLSMQDKEYKVERLYNHLKNVLGPARVLPLPYKCNKKRAEILSKRAREFYDIDTEKEPSYKLVRGIYEDSLVSYPYAVEILAIPFKNPNERDSVSLCAVNYSVSPKENSLEGDYNWTDRNGNFKKANNIYEVLEKNGFHTYNGPISRLPSLIIINLITPKRDPHGYDKSIINTKPFTVSIVAAVARAASGIQTFRGAGYRFQDVDNYRTAKRHDINTKVNARRLLQKFLVSERGLAVTKAE
jgi:hypothetical protein